LICGSRAGWAPQPRCVANRGEASAPIRTRVFNFRVTDIRLPVTPSPFSLLDPLAGVELFNAGRATCDKSYVVTRKICPGCTRLIAIRALSTRGNRSSRALLGAPSTTTPSFRFVRFCWCSRFWSPVTRTEKPAASATSSKAPFFKPAHDSCFTVRTLCSASRPARCPASCRGNCSSSRIRVRTHRFVSGLQDAYHLFPRHRWE